ncbi:MAG TPA: DHA2 family efflux MFS transporter permease subunit [Trebonia sp.]|nr:DHA2 family efflux MFS transporter permease subunit [Trebonia sp.]
MSNVMRNWRGNEWAVLLTLGLGFFMTLLDLTIVNIAIPDMRAGLHASLAGIGWVINAYVIVLAVLVITGGRLGDLRGKRSLFILGVALFTLASLASGLSQTAGQLITARAFQGLGAALLMPQTMSVIIATFPADRRGQALGIWGGIAGLATIAGPTVGGLIVSGLGWRWIFFVNLPVGVLAIVLATIVLPEVKAARRQRLDPPGVLLASASLVAITFGLVEGQQYNWGKVWSFVTIPLVIGLGVVLLAAFLVVQARRQDRDPLLPFGLFADRNYALMGGANLLVSMGLVGMALPLTVYLQSALGFSALKAGLTMAPASLVSGIVAPFAGRLADKGGKYLVACGFTVYACGLAIIAVVAGPASTWHDLLPGFLLSGLGTGCTMSPMQTIATRNVPPHLAGGASGVLNTLRQTGSALGSALVLAVLESRLAAGHGYVGALRAAIAVPITALLLGAVLALALPRLARRQAASPTSPARRAGAGEPAKPQEPEEKVPPGLKNS